MKIIKLLVIILAICVTTQVSAQAKKKTTTKAPTTAKSKTIAKPASNKPSAKDTVLIKEAMIEMVTCMQPFIDKFNLGIEDKLTSINPAFGNINFDELATELSKLPKEDKDKIEDYLNSLEVDDEHLNKCTNLFDLKAKSVTSKFNDEARFAILGGLDEASSFLQMSMMISILEQVLK
jgi:hypothetical protein